MRVSRTRPEIVPSNFKRGLAQGATSMRSATSVMPKLPSVQHTAPLRLRWRGFRNALSPPILEKALVMTSQWKDQIRMLRVKK